VNKGVNEELWNDVRKWCVEEILRNVDEQHAVRTISVESTLALNCFSCRARATQVHGLPPDLPQPEAIHESLSVLPTCKQMNKCSHFYVPCNSITHSSHLEHPSTNECSTWQQWVALRQSKKISLYNRHSCSLISMCLTILQSLTTRLIILKSRSANTIFLSTIHVK
jgi:hypothetical protein